MNQILQTNLKNNNSQKDTSNLNIKNKFKLLFIFSIICIISSIGFFSYNHIKIILNEKVSKNLADSYTILQLYSKKDPFDIPIGDTENTIIR